MNARAGPQSSQDLADSSWLQSSHPLTDTTAVRLLDEVDGKNTVRLLVVVTGEEGRNTAAFATAMVNQLLEKPLDLLARKAASILEESTEASA